MKILFLTDGIHPFQLGGMQKHSLILSRLLAERDVRMHLYHIGGEGYSPDNFKDHYGAEIENITERMIPWPKKNRLPGHYIRENKVYSQLIYDDIKDRINEFDLIYAQGFTGWFFTRQKQKGKLFVPIISNFHGLNMLMPSSGLRAEIENRILTPAVRQIFKGSDYICSFGGRISQALIQFGVPENKILLQSNGIEESWLASKSSNEIRNQRRTITFIGRNDKVKGIEELNTALKQLIKRKELLFRFNFVGPIPDSIKIEDNRIAYFGEIRDSEKIKGILQHSDCLICPSHSEGMPTVILEAMASGLAIIATEVGAVSRMVSDNGILLPEPRPDLIQKSLIQLIEMNAEDLNQFKNRSIEIVQNNFLWDVIADKTITQFRRIIEAAR